jgi:hypothetical protein
VEEVRVDKAVEVVVSEERAETREWAGCAAVRMVRVSALGVGTKNPIREEFPVFSFNAPNAATRWFGNKYENRNEARFNIEAIVAA